MPETGMYGERGSLSVPDQLSLGMAEAEAEAEARTDLSLTSARPGLGLTSD